MPHLFSSFRSFSRWSAVVLLGFCASGWAASPALKVEESTWLPQSPAAVWAVVGDYGGLHHWLPAVTATQISKGRNNERGAVRDLTLKDGAKVVEQLLAYDSQARLMRYRFLATPMPITDYVSTILVQPEGSGSKLIWRGEFNRTEAIDDAHARELFIGIYRAGFDGLRARLSAGGGH